jgi:hypothetical protein
VRLKTCFSCLLLCLTLLTVPVPAQSQQKELGPPHQQPFPDNEIQARIEKEMAKEANEQRQAQLKHDADRLFKLAQQLKQSVDKSNENILSVDVVKKAEEIEKLAHSVREKMKGN